jgi:hypothetical protein
MFLTGRIGQHNPSQDKEDARGDRNRIKATPVGWTESASRRPAMNAPPQKNMVTIRVMYVRVCMEKHIFEN